MYYVDFLNVNIFGNFFYKNSQNYYGAVLISYYLSIRFNGH